MKLLLVLLLALAAQVANAADVEITWRNPTLNVDGSSIPASGAGSLASTRVEWGTCSGTAFGVTQGQQTVLQPATQTVVTGLNAASTYCFRAYVRNTYGEESAASNVLVRAIPAPRPQPPELVSTTLAVWSLKRVGWGSTLELVGTAPIGTPCGALKDSKAGMYEIPRDAVTLHTPLRGGTPVTFCG